MTDEDVITAGIAPGGARRLEMQAFLIAARPIAADLAAMLLFYAVLALTGDVRLGTWLGMAVGLVQVAVMVMERRAVPPMLAVSVSLVVLFGLLTLWFSDPRFILLKTSIFYFAVGATMLKRGWMERYLPPITVGRLSVRLVTAFGLAWATLILGTGALNLVLTFTVSPRAVAAIVGPWSLVTKPALFALQYTMFRRAVRRHVRAAYEAKPAAREPQEKRMPASPESRQIADVAINEGEHPSRRVTLPDAGADAPPRQPVADAITDSAQVGRERPA